MVQRNDTLTGNIGDNVLDGLAGQNTLAGGMGKDIFVVWGPYLTGRPVTEQTDTISDFELPSLDGVLVDVIHLRGFSADAKAEDDDTAPTAIVIGGQRIILTDIAEDDVDDIIGDDGRGSRFMIFTD